MARPLIILNFAVSADGKTSTAGGGASRFTSKADLQRLLEIRLRAEALLIGRGTLEADQMTMTIPETLHPDQQPLRCIISRQGDFDTSHKVFKTSGGAIHLIVTDPTTHWHEDAFAEQGASLHRCSLAEFLALAKNELGVETLLCEGGGTLARELFALDVVDEIHLTLAGHSLIGGKGASTITGLPQEYLPTSREYEVSHFEPNGEGELFVTWRRKK